MELIIKPTAVCNFKCTFCTASKLSINHTPDKVPEQLKELILKLKPNDLIFTGGEPTMCSPKYYEEILELSDAKVSLTSNLKNFYMHPDDWTPLSTPRPAYYSRRMSYLLLCRYLSTMYSTTTLYFPKETLYNDKKE